MDSPIDMATIALAKRDEETRPDRARRLVWLSQFQQTPAMLWDRFEPGALLAEARSCYVDGHLVAAIQIATAFVEQTIVEALELTDNTEPRHTFQLAIKAARKANLFDSELLGQADRLRENRNPLSHRQSEKNYAGIGVKLRKEKRHPASILEDQAMSAIEVMYGILGGVAGRGGARQGAHGPG